MRVETLADQMFFVTVKIVTNVGTGTGFIFRHKWAEDKEGIFLVTNKHVVSGAQNGKLTFIRSDGTNPLLGMKYDIKVSDFEKWWFGHPDQDIDIAVFSLASVFEELQSRQWEVYIKATSIENIPTQAQLESLDAIEEIVFVGYPIGIWDEKNFLPVARRGVTATPVSVDYENQPIFLIDASVFPGSSGSPVFIYNAGSYPGGRGSGVGLVLGSRFFFLGVISAVFFHEENGSVTYEEIPTTKTPIVRTRQMINLAVVFKARTVIETIEALLRQVGELK